MKSILSAMEADIARVKQGEFKPVFDEVIQRIERAKSFHPDYHSPHEAYAILKEEVDEFWDEVKKKYPQKRDLRAELIDVMVVAARAIIDLKL